MKKKLSILLTALVLLTIAVSCTQDVTVDAQLYNKEDTDVFMLNGKYYATLQEAVNARLGKGAKAAGDNDGIIYLRKNAAGPGAVINDPNTPVVIDFAGWTYSFKDVTATQGSTTGTFGLSITGGAEVTLKGLEQIDLHDTTANLTMVYVEGTSTKLTIEAAPKMKVEPTQYVFWAANGATLTIGGETTMTGGLAATGTAEKTPLVSINDGAKADVSNMKLESAKVVPNSTKELKVASLDSSESKIISTGSGAVTITESEGTVVVQNTGTGTVKVDENIIDVNKAEEIVDGQSTGTVSVTVAMIGTTEYTDIDDAVTQGDGNTIKLVSNITDTSISSPADAVVTVDLNGKQVGTYDNPVIITIGTSGEFYIQNISETVGLVYVTPPLPDQLIISGGKYNLDVTSYLADNCICVEEDGFWVVKATEPEVSVLLSGETTARTMSLAAFRNAWDEGVFDGETVSVELLKDVDISGEGWKPIGNGSYPFYGTFEGNHHTINGLTNDGYVIGTDDVFTTSSSKTKGAAYGFFGVVGSATDNDAAVVIRNIEFTNVDIDLTKEVVENGSNMCGALIGADVRAAKKKVNTSDVTINDSYDGNITVSGVSVSGNHIKSADSTGGIVGKVYTKGIVSVTSCTVDLDVYIAQGLKGAGVVAFASGPSMVYVRNNTINGNVYFAGYNTAKNITGGRCYASMTVITASKFGKNFVFGDTVNNVTGKLYVGTTNPEEYLDPFTLSYTFDENGNATSATFNYISEEERESGKSYLDNNLVIFCDGAIVNGMYTNDGTNDNGGMGGINTFGTVVMNDCYVNGIYNSEEGGFLTLNNCQGTYVKSQTYYGTSSVTSDKGGNILINGGNYTLNDIQNCLSEGRIRITVTSGRFADGYVVVNLPGSTYTTNNGWNYNGDYTYDDITYTITREGGSNVWVVTNAPASQSYNEP